MAMLDAEVLAAVVKHGKVRNDLSDRTLMLYEEGRRSVVERVMETSHHQTVHHTATGTWHDVWGVREYKWSERDPGLKYELAISIAGLRNPTAGALSIPEAIEVKGVTEAIKGRA
jgi:2-polyprenyl-6-methoxyphenol hydroxylase-like FAD-dependent oxidoreductase